MRPTSPSRVALACESSELAVECARLAEPLGIALDPSWAPDALALAVESMHAGGLVAVATTTPPDDHALARLAARATELGARVALAVVAPDAGTSATTLALATELGIPAVDELRPLLSVVALLAAGTPRPWAASTRRLSAADRARLRFVTSTTTRAERSGARLVPLDGAVLGMADGLRDDGALPVGEARDVAAALLALEAAAPDTSEPLVAPADVNRRAVLDVVFGPPRALSDPASKQALRPYGVPFPVEELCTSPSRATSEAGRIGFPVRIALASPDLRVWDHPDLAVDGVDHAARVRDVHRQLTTAAASRAPTARILGVTVTATTPAQALLRAVVTALDAERVAVRLSFADAHGRASGDETVLVLPASEARVERGLERLAGAELVLGGTASLRRETVHAIGDVLTRLAAFARDYREAVVRIEAHPLAVLTGGRVEVREACIVVSDAFVRAA